VHAHAHAAACPWWRRRSITNNLSLLLLLVSWPCVIGYHQCPSSGGAAASLIIVRPDG
jgi:hypothetical protein